MRTRLALLVFALPLSFYAYACSSDDDPPAAPGDDAGVDGSQPPPGDGGGQPDTGPPADGGDAGPPLCTGNPLTADGGTPDGGAMIGPEAGAGAPRQLATSVGDYYDGPTYTDLFGGALVFSQVFGPFTPRVVRMGPDGGAVTEVRARADGEFLPIGNAIRGNTILTALAPTDLAQAAGIWQTFADGGAGPTLETGDAVDPNDLVALKDGTIFFTDPGFQLQSTTTGIFRIAGDGGVMPVQTFNTNTNRANGIALSPDEKTLYVAFTDTKRIVKYTITNGVAAQPEDLSITLIDDPDGIAVDEGGNLWIAESVRPTDFNAPENGGRVEVFAPDGTKHGEITFPDHRPTGVAFGGPDNKSVYVTANQFNLATYSGFVFVYGSRCAGVR
jgi:sugar lactone lactonase YvrE